MARHLNTIIKSFYVDSVVDEINELLMAKGLGDNFDSLRKDCNSSYSQCINFITKDGNVLEKINFKAIMILTDELVEDLLLERNAVYRAFLSPFYTESELSDDEIALIMFLSKEEDLSMSVDRIEKSVEEGSLTLSDLEVVIPSLLRNRIIRMEDDVVLLINTKLIPNWSQLIEQNQ